MKKLILLLLILSSGNHLLSQENSRKFYEDIAKSISSAQGTIDLYFGSGYWTKTVNGKKVIIQFSENQKAKLKFAYSGGQLQDGSKVTFTPGIHIYVRTNTVGLSLRLDEISYDENGKFASWKVNYDNPPTNNLNYVANVQDALRLNDKSEHLFTLKFLRTFGDARKSNESGSQLEPVGRPVLNSIIIRKPNENEPGLAVSLIPNSTIRFSTKSSSVTYDNKFSFTSGSLEIRYLEYDIQSKKVECEIKQFDLNVSNGILQTSDLFVNVRSGSKLQFSRIKILRDDHNNEVNSENGTFNIQVGSGTKVTLHKTSNYPSELVFENGEMNLFDFVYQENEGNRTVIKIGGGSSLKVSTRSGTISLCDDKGYLSLANGMLEARMFGTWNSREPEPDSHLDISLFSLSVDGGKLPITETNVVGIKSGYVKSESLRFDGLTFSSLVGEVKDLSVTLDDNSRFTIPGGIDIKIKEGSVITGATPNNPLKLNVQQKYISGVFDFNLGFSGLVNSTNQVVQLHDGVVEMKVDVFEDMSFKGREVFVKGRTKLTAQNAAFDATLEFLNGTFSSVRGQQPEFDSKVKIALEASNQIDMVTPYLKPQDDVRIFPISLSVRIARSVMSQEGNISFKGQSVNLDQLIMSPTFIVDVPPGKGEHRNPDDPNSTDPERDTGPGWSHDDQEAIFYDCPNPAGWMHFYLFAAQYKIGATMKLAIVNNVISFNLGSIAFNDQIMWGKDGCDLAEILGVLGSIAGSLVGGPGAGTLLGGIVGVVAGNDIESNLKGVINAGIARKISEFEFNKEWAFN